MDKARQWMAACLLAVASAAASAGNSGGSLPPTGHYATRPGWAELVISFDGTRRRFALDSGGDSSPGCALSGVLEEDGSVLASNAAPQCRLRLRPTAEGWRTEVVDAAACRQHCGMAVALEGEFVPLPDACRWQAREQARASFRQHYDRRAYAQALGVLDQLQASCGRFIDWLEADALANDRAITEFRLGRPEQCLRTLAATRAAGVSSVDQLASQLQLNRLQQQAYLPVARATLYNRNKCSQAVAAL